MGKWILSHKTPTNQIKQKYYVRLFCQQWPWKLHRGHFPCRGAKPPAGEVANPSSRCLALVAAPFPAVNSVCVPFNGCLGGHPLALSPVVGLVFLGLVVARFLRGHLFVVVFYGVSAFPCILLLMITLSSQALWTYVCWRTFLKPCTWAVVTCWVCWRCLGWLD